MACGIEGWRTQGAWIASSARAGSIRSCGEGTGWTIVILEKALFQAQAEEYNTRAKSPLGILAVDTEADVDRGRPFEHGQWPE